jgi:hypothetical protein
MIAKYEKMRTWIVAHDMISILFGLVFCRFEHKFFGVVLFVCWLCFESGGLEASPSHENMNRGWLDPRKVPANHNTIISNENIATKPS